MSKKHCLDSYLWIFSTPTLILVFILNIFSELFILDRAKCLQRQQIITLVMIPVYTVYIAEETIADWLMIVYTVCFQVKVKSGL